MTANFKPRFSHRQWLGWSVTVLILVATFAYSSGASADEFNTNSAGGTGGDQFNTNPATTCHQSARGPALRATYGEPTILPIGQLNHQTGSLYVICTGDDCRNDVADCWGRVSPPGPNRIISYDDPSAPPANRRPLEGRTQENQSGASPQLGGTDPFAPQQPSSDNPAVRPPINGDATVIRRPTAKPRPRFLVNAKHGKATLIIPEAGQEYGYFEPIEFTLPAGKPYGKSITVDLKINLSRKYFYVSVTGDLTQGIGDIDTFRPTSAFGRNEASYNVKAVTVSAPVNGMYDWKDVSGGAVTLK